MRPRLYKFKMRKTKLRNTHIVVQINQSKEVASTETRTGVTQSERWNSGLGRAHGDVSKGLMVFYLLTC